MSSPNEGCSEPNECLALGFNGLLISEKFVPEEVIITILSFVPWKDLPSCRLVCRTWKRLVDISVCFEKLNNKCHHCLSKQIVDSKLAICFGQFPFYLNFSIGNPKSGLGKNLIKNSFGFEGRNKFKFWNVVNSGGSGWKVESSPVGCNPLPDELKGKSCFVTSYGLCSKTQLINLARNGLHPKIMDAVQPDIEISDWYAARFDCGILYQIKVSLLNDLREPIVEFEDEKTLTADTDWYKISHTFKDYGEGVRYVLFEHGGKDTQFWAGHYGSKMAGASVVALLPQRVLEPTFWPTKAEFF